VRALALASLAIGLWAAIVWATGGFLLELGPVHFSSRSPRNPLILAAVGYAMAWLMSTRDERRRVLALTTAPADRLVAQAPRPTSVIVGLAAAAFVVFVGIDRGFGTAGGADVYGYVSQGELWARGSVRVEEPLLTRVDWPTAPDILSPLGYRPAPDRKTIVPVYPPGFPMVLGLFERLGGRRVVFYVVPLFAGIAVLTTYRLGSFMGGPAAGALAATLLATSPAFLFQDLVAMSDVPVTAWWAISLLLLTSRRPVIAAAAGLAGGMAVLTRPNLAPLALAPAAVVAWRGWRSRNERWTSWTRLLLFCAGTGAGCVALAVFNARLYGSPLASGYGDIISLYSFGNILTNAKLYTAWTMKSQTPLVVCALVAPAAVAWRSMAGDTVAKRDAFAASLGVVLLTVASYLPYAVFEGWFWLRFLLPAWPPLLVFTSLGVIWLCGRVAGTRGVVLAAGIVLIVGIRNVDFLRRDGAFGMQEGERKSPAIGHYIADHMSERAVFLAMQQSGSIRYYSGRLTLRFDWIPPTDLDRVLGDLVRLGYHPYVLLEEWEEPNFKAQFASASAAGALDWPPVVRLQHSSRVKIYDLIDLPRQKSEGRAPTIVF